jgi:hypothetical protein
MAFGIVIPPLPEDIPPSEEEIVPPEPLTSLDPLVRTDQGGVVVTDWVTNPAPTSET